jgi:hypothetical protein
MERGIAMPADYEKARSDCGVLAVAIAAGVSYVKAHAALRYVVKTGMGRNRPCKRWSGGTTTKERQAVLHAFGIQFYVMFGIRRQRLENLVLRLDYLALLGA